MSDKSRDANLIKQAARWIELDQAYQGDDSPQDAVNEKEQERLGREIATTPAHFVIGALAKLRVADQVEQFTKEGWDWARRGPAPCMIASAIADLERIAQGVQ